MSINFNVTGDRRKELVKAISEILGKDTVYNGAPTFSFSVGGCTVDRNGVLSFSDEISGDEADGLVTALKERGFEAESEVVPEPESDRDNTLAIEMPKEGFTDETLENLKKIIVSKESIIKKALGADNLPVETDGDKLRFPWFTLTGIDGEADAYSRFVCALCKMAKEQKRVTAKEREAGNDKFVMRLFLIRLGFIGPEYKAARHILLKNLTGNGSWKSGKRPVRSAESADEHAAEALDANT